MTVDGAIVPAGHAGAQVGQAGQRELDDAVGGREIVNVDGDEEAQAGAGCCAVPVVAVAMVLAALIAAALALCQL